MIDRGHDLGERAFPAQSSDQTDRVVRRDDPLAAVLARGPLVKMQEGSVRRLIRMGPVSFEMRERGELHTAAFLSPEGEVAISRLRPRQQSLRKQRIAIRRVLAGAGLDPWSIAVAEYALEENRWTLTRLYRLLAQMDRDGMPRTLTGRALRGQGAVDDADLRLIETSGRYADALATRTIPDEPQP